MAKSQYNYAPLNYIEDKEPFQINYVPQIEKNVFESFKYSDFTPIVFYTDSIVDFVVISDSTNIKHTCVKQITAIQMLNKMFTDLKYCCFKIKTGTLSTGEDVIYARVFVFPEKESYGMDVFFVIKDKKYISFIAVK
jgi:hypothetical protein